MKIHWKQLAVCMALPLAVGAIAGAATMESAQETFEVLQKPPLSPPGWLFPVVWTVLYLLMGFASYLVVSADAPKEAVRAARRTYGLQLAVNFFWSILFFGFGRYCLSILWLVLLWGLIVLTILRFRAVSTAAARLLAPYLLWVTFAGYLNLGICILNR